VKIHNPLLLVIETLLFEQMNNCQVVCLAISDLSNLQRKICKHNFVFMTYNSKAVIIFLKVLHSGRLLY